MDRKRKVIVSTLGTVILLAFAFLLVNVFQNLGAIVRFVSGSGGLLGPAIIIALHVVEALTFFIPGNFMSPFCGYIFGFWKGFVINFIGTMLGTASLFLAARKASKIFEYSGFSPKRLKRVGKFMRRLPRRSAYIVSRVVPFSPADAVTIFVAAFTKNGFGEFILFTAIGSLPTTVIETLAGAMFRTLRQDFPTLAAGIIVAAAVIALLATWHYVSWRRKRRRRLAKRGGKSGRS